LPPEIQHKKIVVVIPVYNEGPVIRQVITSLLKIVTTIIVVDDGSSIPVIKQLHDLPVVLLQHKVNLGQGAAIQTGLTYARKLHADIAITFDADGQHNEEDINSLLAPIINNEADVVLGSRFLHDSVSTVPFTKKFILQVARIINFLFSGVLLTDAHNGLRALNRKALEKTNLTENRMAHASEFLFEIKNHKLRWKEIPVHIRYTDYSIQKGQKSRDSIKVLFDLLLHKFFK
jgi:glycosyltransferase involved in cell wall biosynthesis